MERGRLAITLVLLLVEGLGRVAGRFALLALVRIVECRRPARCVLAALLLARLLVALLLARLLLSRLLLAGLLVALLLARSRSQVLARIVHVLVWTGAFHVFALVRIHVRLLN